MKTTVLPATALIALICLSAGACSSSTNQSTSNTTGASEKATANTDSSTDSKESEPKVQELNYGGIGTQPVQDPHGSLFSEVDWVRLRAIYDTLIATDERGKRVGGIAQSMEPNDDASEWTLKLDKGATFSDKTPLTADDVLYTLQRLDKKKAENGMRLATVDVAKSKKVDDHTITLATSSPDADLPRALSGMIFVVKKDTKDFAKHIGAGAYTVDKTSAQASTLTRRNDFWGKKPKLEKIIVYSFSDPKALSQAMESKKIDVAASMPVASAKVLEKKNGAVIAKRPGAVAAPLLMRVDKGPFAKAEVRKAVKLALDRQAMVDTVYSGFGVTGKDMMKLTDPSVPNDVPEVKADLTQAKELMSKAGAESLDVTLHTTSAYPAMKTTATVAKEQLKKIGINVTIKEHDPSTYWSKAYTVEPFTVGYWVDTPFATTVRQTTLSTSGFSETGWKDKKFDQDFAAAMALTDEAKRNDALGKLHKRMAAEGGWVVWGFGDSLTVHDSKVTGLNTKHNANDLSGVSISGN